MHVDIPGQLASAVEASLVDVQDEATAQLARTYAEQIDAGGDLSKLGPPLLAALESMLLSPRARAAAKKAVTGAEHTANPIDQLADRRRSRAAPVDAAAP